MLTELIITKLLLGSILLHSQTHLTNQPEFDQESRIIPSESSFSYCIKEDIKSSDPDKRISAITRAGEKKIKQAFPYLTEALNDKDCRIRGVAAMALGKLDNTLAIPYLTNALKDTNHAVRGSAALSLGRIKAIEAVDSLIMLLNDPNYSVRLSATYSLGLIGSPRAIKPIISLLKDDIAQVRENAAWVLGLLKAKEALPFLVLLEEDPNESVRISVKRAIFNIKINQISDISSVKYSGGNGSCIEKAIKITGISNSFACLRSRTEYLNKLYGDNSSWEQVDQIHIKRNNKHYTLVTIKEHSSGRQKQIYFDVTDFFSKF